MVKTDLIQALQKQGLERAFIQDLFLFYLNTEDRQLQLQEWLQSQSRTCTQEEIRAQAQEILQGFLRKNPYNAVSKDRVIPKWRPRREPAVRKASPPTPTVQEARAEAAPPVSEPPKPERDPFEDLLQIFARQARP